MGKFVFSVSCFDDCHISVMVVVVAVVSKNYLLNDHTRTNIFNIHNNHYIIVQGHRGDQGGGISFFISYISLGVCARVQLNTFHILSINNANKCGELWTHILLSCPAIYTIHIILYLALCCSIPTYFMLMFAYI